MLNILMIVQQDAVQCTEHTAWCNQRNVGLVKCTSIDIGRNVYFCVNFVINVEAFIVHRISHFIFYMIAEHLFPAQLPTAPHKPHFSKESAILSPAAKTCNYVQSFLAAKVSLWLCFKSELI